MKEDISSWLKEYSKNNNDLCFIIGISGGIDSAVVSTLCAMTGIETHVISLPIDQKSDQLKRAKDHAKWLCDRYQNVRFHEVDLTNAFKSIKNNLSQFDTDLGWANTKSRLRMLTLYQIATYHRGLVVGTGNKIEDFGVGFFTKYGDGGVDISPIADLTKTEVRKLAKDLKILDDIIKAKPTDGLWEDDRSDEDQIGATYEELEWAMEYNGDSVLNDRQKEVLKIYKKLNLANRHKMIEIPTYKKHDYVYSIR
jgi:NAD+ synthase